MDDDATKTQKLRLTPEHELTRAQVAKLKWPWQQGRDPYGDGDDT